MNCLKILPKNTETKRIRINRQGKPRKIIYIEALLCL